MTKLQALTRYLIERQMVLPEQLDSWTDQVQVELIWKPTEKGLHMGDMRYSATIAIERFADQPTRLFALVGSWLENNDQDRDGLANVVFDVVMLDNDLADVDIKVDFLEAQHLTEDLDGEIEIYGKTWSLAPYELWVAEQGEVSAHVA
ncbi:phage tail protein [Pseudomonas putida]|uniref:phage tail protein n=1 Tax=Pseudomonas putida group TaxID=136845 RepID=UPI0018A94AC8|nr:MULTISPECIES: phage tail protein [Pseudomonas putida group]MBF8766687.1 phage tail protein [Pseudomonas putida]MEC4022542.1 phage tail protein [Pseudomonas fulva]